MDAIRGEVAKYVENNRLIPLNYDRDRAILEAKLAAEMAHSDILSTNVRRSFEQSCLGEISQAQFKRVVAGKKRNGAKGSGMLRAGCSAFLKKFKRRNYLVGQKQGEITLSTQLESFELCHDLRFKLCKYHVSLRCSCLRPCTANMIFCIFGIVPVLGACYNIKVYLCLQGGVLCHSHIISCGKF